VGEFVNLDEVFEQVLDAAIPVSRLAEFGRRVEAHVAEHAAEFRLVRVLDRLQSDVDALADVVGVACSIELIEGRALGHDETLALHAPPHADFVTLVLGRRKIDTVSGTLS
jgi:hypothetical protein